MTETLLEVKQLQVAVGLNPVIEGLNFSIQRGETFALVGESGCGKTLTSLAILQLLPMAACFVQGTEIFFSQKNLLNLPEVAMRKIRGGRISIVFQEPMSSLNPVLSIGDQIAEVLHCHSRLSAKAKRQRAIELLTSVGINDPEHCYEQYPHQLSGGMKQRVMIAIAIAAEPDLLIADEPTSSLDVTTQAQVLSLLKQLQKKMGMAILLITHDLGVVKEMADRVGVMYAGHLVEEAKTKDFFAEPKHPYSRKLFAALPQFSNRETKLAAIPGIVSPLAEIDTACRFAARCDFAWGACREQLPRWLDLTDVHYVRCHLWDSEQHSPQKADPSPTQNSHGVFLQTTIEKTPLLVVDQLKMYFPVQKGLFKRRVAWIKAVDGISFTLQAGRTLALIGESGSGKTTAGFGITQLLKPYAGEVHYRGINLAKASSAEWLKVRHFMQMIFQDPYSSLNPRMRVGDILAEGIDALGLIKDSDARHERISQLLQQVGLPESSQDRYPHEFSGGQRQRIAIARALAVQPELIICDEPTSALDISVQAQILNLLRQLQSDLGLAYLFITHNIAVVSYMADDVAVMYRGQIVEQGTVEDVLKKPKHPYTKALLAAVTN